MYDPLSRTAQEIAKIKVHGHMPDEARDAEIADMWDIVWAEKNGRTGVQLAVAGDIEHTSGWLIGVDAHFRWVRTAEQIWRLGWPNDAYPPIVQTSMRPDRRRAYEHALERTGRHTLPGLLRQATRRMSDATIAAVADVARRQNRPAVAEAWELLMVDGTDKKQTAAGALAISAAVASMLPRDRDGEVMAMLDAWNRLPQSPATNPDPFAAAQVGRVPSVLNEVFVRIRDDEESGGGTLH